MDWIDLGIKIVTLLIAIGAMIVAFFRTRKQETNASFKAGTKRMDDHGLRISQLEQTVKSMPEKDDMHRLELQLAGMAGDMKTMAASMKGYSDTMRRMENVLTRHEDHLLESGKTK